MILSSEYSYSKLWNFNIIFPKYVIPVYDLNDESYFRNILYVYD